MLGHTKTRHISTLAGVEADIFKVVCPSDRADAIKKYLASQGCALEYLPESAQECEIEELVSPATVFPNRSPATLLRGIRNREGLTQQQLADLCEISRHHISEMETGKRSIGKRNAAKFGTALHADPRLFL